MKKKADSLQGEEDRNLGPCPICGREMLAGESVDRHHWQPKSQGGRTSDYLHRTCHRKLHSLFTDKELSSDFSTPEAVRQHPEIRKFIAWVRRQPPEAVLRHRKPKGEKVLGKNLKETDSSTDSSPQTPLTIPPYYQVISIAELRT